MTLQRVATTTGHPHQPDHPDHPHHPDCPSHPGNGIWAVQSKGSDMPSTTWSSLVFPSESFMTLCICHWKRFQYPTSGDKCLSPGIFSHNCLESLLQHVTYQGKRKANDSSSLQTLHLKGLLKIMHVFYVSDNSFWFDIWRGEFSCIFGVK